MRTTRQLDRTTWQHYLEDLTAELRGVPTHIEVLGEDIGAQVEARGVLLNALAYDPDERVFDVEVSVPSPGHAARLRHFVDDPRALAVDSADGILPTTLRVEGRDGTQTLVRMTPAAPFTG